MLKTAKMLMRKIQEDLNNWKGICYSWIARLNTVKMSFVPKLIYRLNAIPIKTPARHFLQIQMSGYTYITLQLCKTLPLGETGSLYYFLQLPMNL